MNNRTTKFVDVILPIAVPNLYTYRVPFEWNNNVGVGYRVIVQFGKKKLYSAIVKNIHEEAPKHYQAKYIESILDVSPIVTLNQLELWEWIAGYYMCTVGEVMGAALPTGLKLASETKILLNGNDVDIESLTDQEYLIVEALQIQEILEIKQIEDILDIKTVYPILKSLLDRHIIILAEEVKDKYKPKKVSYLSLLSTLQSDEKVKLTFNELERAPKQLDAFMIFFQLLADDLSKEIKKSFIKKHHPTHITAFNQLIKKQILQETKKKENRIPLYNKATQDLFDLTPEQGKAFDQIKQGFGERKTVLLHGITGSGKTEIYVHLIQEQLNKNKQVLYLLPEIALTTQIISRLKQFFGDKVGVFHSRFNAHERVETWVELLRGDKSSYKIIIGARSAIFLPFHELGLIIVDEEHDNSFKQYDPAPRYHARDTAIYLAKKNKAHIVLGSATPSIESYYNATKHKYLLVELTKRYSGVKLPEILCSDLQKAHKRKEMNSHFSTFLLDHIKQSLEQREQIILFQNRRGYNPLWSCEVCGWVPQCKNCDVSMTYHKHIHVLKCHYCGYHVKPENKCQACGSHKLKMVGFGTEKIEEELALFFPEKSIKRMDLDTTRAKNSYQNLIDEFQEGAIDILVGTQMVTKGLDFDNVGMVGVLSGDSLLHYPDFRSFEHSFQLLTQVSGRAGRKEKRGKVIIQTFTPDHWVIQKVIQHDYEGMYNQEILERKNFHYPPFYRLIKLTIKHRDRQASLNTANHLKTKLEKKLGNRVLGPEAPYISRIKNRYLYHLIIKFEKDLAPNKVKEFIQEVILSTNQEKDHKASFIIPDVDFI